MRGKLQGLIKPLLEIGRETGDAICEHYHGPDSADFEAKGDDSPLTSADLAADQVLQKGLKALAPEVPVLSEESGAAVRKERRQWQQYWLIDPLDGTREFLARTGEFTVNIALIDNHRPVLGLLYLPLRQLGYVGIPGVGSRCYRRGEGAEWTSRALHVRPLEAGRPLVLLASRRHRNHRLRFCLDWLTGQWGACDRQNSGSALKFCQLAEGRGDFYPRFTPCCEWDTAAGQALLEGAGGCLLDLSGQPLRYNTKASLYSPDFLAIADTDHPLWARLLRELPPGP